VVGSDAFASNPAPTFEMRSSVGASLLAKNDDAVYRCNTRIRDNNSSRSM
jgi:hypothetical protein